MTTHTQAPWRQDGADIYQEKTGSTLVYIPNFNEDNEQHQANARLISAAPEMYELLKQVQHHELPEHLQKKIAHVLFTINTVNK